MRSRREGTYPTLVRIVAAGTTLEDPGRRTCTEWALEISSPEDPSVSRPIFEGTRPVDETRAIADRAAARPLPAPGQGPGRQPGADGSSAAQYGALFVHARGRMRSRSTILGCCPDSSCLGVRAFTNAKMTADGKTVLPRVEGAKYAFGLNTTSGNPLYVVLGRVPHCPRARGSPTRRTSTALGEDMVVWDASSAARSPSSRSGPWMPRATAPGAGDLTDRQSGGSEPVRVREDARG